MTNATIRNTSSTKNNGQTRAVESKPNGIDLTALNQMVRDVKADPNLGIVRFSASTKWNHAFASRTTVDGWVMAGRHLPQDFTIDVDEPEELLGSNKHANPQQYLLAAMNTCMLNTFVAVCSTLGVEIESLELDSSGELDLRGFLGIDSNIRPGYDEIKYTIRVKGNGSQDQYRKAHEAMKATSPNYYNMAHAIALRSDLVIED